ncbi:MAG: peptide deformylase [bacterium]|nr:peptide deformylase [Myxococcales bacterium]MCB9542685.1 peptide deformylase [Myxococcales bacterium]MCB9552863.1 peptide deformylase [Myxococcales bacterium]
MAVLDVLPYPNPFLRKRAHDVEAFDDALRRTVADLEETMADEDGLGLAATQVGIDLRLLILARQAFEGEAGKGKPNVVIANPEVVWQSDELELGEEGCLSFPGVFIQVERPKRVRIRARDQHGEVFEIEGEGLGARAILHEIDHLNGVVMIDHVSHLTRKRALKKHERNQKALVAQARRKAKA